MEIDNKTHVRLRRSWRSVIPGMLFALLMAILVLWLSIQYDVYGITFPLGFLGLNYNFTFPLYVFVFIVFMARPIFTLYNCRHEIGEHHVYSVQGIWSLKRDHVEIPFEDILGVRYKQTILQRIFDVGDILVWTANADRPEIVMEGIGEPEEGMHIIRSRIDQTILSEKHKTIKPQASKELDRQEVKA